jgi:hypothetical protein
MCPVRFVTYVSGRSFSIGNAMRIIGLTVFFFSCASVWGAVGGSISGTVTDHEHECRWLVCVHRHSSGALRHRSQPDRFQAYKRTGLILDVDTALKVDVPLDVGEQSEHVTVLDTAVHIDLESTEMGEVVAGKVMTAVALNGRSYTDLMALQPGIAPMSTQQPDSIVMAGASVAIAPSGGLNPANQSISGQREDANGFLINGGDVKEEMNGGTSIVPNLDSIAEFRILTNNFDAEYGNYSGGIVNVVTKSGANQLHGTAFEFLRNTALDAKNFFSPERGFYRQNQFGSTVGAPIKKSHESGDRHGINFSPFDSRPGGKSRRPRRLSHWLCGGTLSCQLSLAKARLRDFRQRAVLHSWLHREHAMRFSECRNTRAGLVGTRQTSAAIHPCAKYRELYLFHRLFRREGARRPGQFPRGRQHYTLGPALCVLFL